MPCRGRYVCRVRIDASDGSHRPITAQVGMGLYGGTLRYYAQSDGWVFGEMRPKQHPTCCYRTGDTVTVEFDSRSAEFWEFAFSVNEAPPYRFRAVVRPFPPEDADPRLHLGVWFVLAANIRVTLTPVEFPLRAALPA
jgi:hypothetical protein